MQPVWTQFAARDRPRVAEVRPRARGDRARPGGARDAGRRRAGVDLPRVGGDDLDPVRRRGGGEQEGAGRRARQSRRRTSSRASRVRTRAAAGSSLSGVRALLPALAPRAAPLARRRAATTPSRRGPEPGDAGGRRCPQDGATVRAETVAVEGTVAARRRRRCRCSAKDVDVDDGRWRAEVAARARAPTSSTSRRARTGRRPDFASLRIVLEVRVTVPDVVGDDAETAQDQLEGLGLKVDDRGRRRLLRPAAPGRPGRLLDASPRRARRCCPAPR